MSVRYKATAQYGKFPNVAHEEKAEDLSIWGLLRFMFKHNKATRTEFFSSSGRTTVIEGWGKDAKYREF